MYEVKQRGKVWFVVHSTTKDRHGPFKDEAQAERAAARLNANPPPGLPTTQKWTNLIAKNSEEIQEALQLGYEPYAVEDGKIYFKREVKRNG